MESSNPCIARTTKGQACGMSPLRDSEFCWAHDPARVAERDAARRKGGRNRRRPKGPGLEFALENVDSVRDLVERGVRDTLALENSVPRSRAIAQLATIALKVFEVAELEERVQKLEGAVVGH